MRRPFSFLSPPPFGCLLRCTDLSVLDSSFPFPSSLSSSHVHTARGLRASSSAPSDAAPSDNDLELDDASSSSSSSSSVPLRSSRPPRPPPPALDRRRASTGNRQTWTRREERCFQAALEDPKIRNHRQCWVKILERHGKDGTKDEELARRNNQDLKDKARNLKLQYVRAGMKVPVWLQGGAFSLSLLPSPLPLPLPHTVSLSFLLSLRLDANLSSPSLPLSLSPASYVPGEERPNPKAVTDDEAADEEEAVEDQSS